MRSYIFFRKNIGFLQPYTVTFCFFTEQQQIPGRTDHLQLHLHCERDGGTQHFARFGIYSDIYLKLINEFVLTELMLRKKTTCHQAGHLTQARVPGGQPHRPSISESSKPLLLWASLAWASLAPPGFSTPSCTWLLLCRHSQKVYKLSAMTRTCWILKIVIKPLRAQNFLIMKDPS